MIVYADSSFLVPAYVLDRHSTGVSERMRGSLRIVVTPFHRAELANAFHQCVFRSALSEFEAARACKRFDEDQQAGIYESVRFPDPAWDRAISLAHRYCGSLGVRTLDTLHVACALELKAERFWTFDERQAKLAEAVGLDTSG